MTVEKVWTECRECYGGHVMPGRRLGRGLAVVNITDHPCATHEHAMWSVTHAPSGFAVCYACCGAEAQRVADRIIGAADWDQPAGHVRDRALFYEASLASVGVEASAMHRCDDHPHPPLAKEANT